MSEVQSEHRGVSLLTEPVPCPVVPMLPSPNDETLLFSNVDLSLYVDDGVNGSGIGTSS